MKTWIEATFVIAFARISDVIFFDGDPRHAFNAGVVVVVVVVPYAARLLWRMHRAERRIRTATGETLDEVARAFGLTREVETDESLRDRIHDVARRTRWR